MNDYQVLNGIAVFIIAVLLELAYWILMAEKVLVMEGFCMVYRWKYAGTKGKHRIVLYFLLLIMYFITCVHV